MKEESRSERIETFFPEKDKKRPKKREQEHNPNVARLIEEIRDSFTAPENNFDDPNEKSDIRAKVTSNAYEKADLVTRRPVLAIGDLDADFDALVHILDQTGYIDLSVNKDKSKNHIKLREKAENDTVVLTGDFFDRGKKFLLMADFIQTLRQNSVDIKTTAGNHETMAFHALSCPSVKEQNPHFYALINYAKKVLTHTKKTKQQINPFKLIQFINHADSKQHFKGREEQHHKDLIAFAEWYCQSDEPPAFLTELTENRKDLFSSKNPSLQEQIEAAHSLFFNGGEYAEFLQQMTLMERVDDVLFLHAGINDYWAMEIKKHGIDGVNEKFRQALQKGNLTNYVETAEQRALFWQRHTALTPFAASVLKDLGIHAIIRGHDIQMDGMPTLRKERGISVISNDIGIKLGNLGGTLITGSGDIVAYNDCKYQNRRVIGNLPRYKSKPIPTKEALNKKIA